MIPKTESTLIFFVNGRKVTDKDVDPELTLLQYLRNKLRLCGTKLGCGEGRCGACTVMVSKYDRKQQKVIHLPVNSCLAPICSIHGMAVTTVEGIGSTGTKLHPTQERIAKAHGSQCGFCTPGMVMSMYTLLRNKPKPSMEALEETFQGNLCRCTGYRPIIEAYKTFTEDGELMQNVNQFAQSGSGCAMGENCCKLNQNNDAEALFEPSEFTPYDNSQEPIFPPELKMSDALDLQSLYFKGKNVEWYRPTHLKDLLELKSRYPNAKIIVGNTEVGVEVYLKHLTYPVLIQPVLIPEMTVWKINDDHISFGASVTLQEMEDVLREQIETQPEYKTRMFKAIVDMLHWIACKQIRSVAAVGGNIMTGSPVSDLNPIFMAANIGLELQSKTDSRKVLMDDKFFTGCRRNIAKSDEILVSINIPYTKENQYFLAHKQARRRDADIAIVNCAVNISFKESTNIISDIKLAFGGMAPTIVMAPKTQEKLIGLEWNTNTLETAYGYLLEDLPLSPSASGGMIEFRKALVVSFFFRSFLNISYSLKTILPDTNVEPQNLSGMKGFHYKIPKSSQYFEVIPETKEKHDSIGRPIVHVSAFKQAAGEAVYCDDIPFFENELYMALVYSTKAHAKILYIDPTEALNSDGVAGFISAKDIPDHLNATGPVVHDEEIFVSKIVTSQGQILGAILAEDQLTAQKAARKVKVEYEELTPIIISIEDAIEHNSFYEDSLKSIQTGDVDEAFKNSQNILEGQCRTGYQEHFYLETQAVIAVPKKEDDEYDIYISGQQPSEINASVARLLEVPQNRIVTKVKRIGGGFGGKETRGAIFALPAALAASKFKRPVRIMLDRDEDMAATGGRHPFLIKYKVGFNNDGKILGCEVHIYNNGGYSRDVSIPVLEGALLQFENTYKIPNVRVFGYTCKTNVPSNTACRGHPQGMFSGETMVRDIADHLNKDAVEVSKINLYQEGDTTHYNQKLINCTLQRCWDECLESSNYFQRKADVEQYNKENRWKKRGISVVPTKLGIAFTLVVLNQAGALLLIYQDGSVLLSHGGIEMGQGLHTKMIQVASKTLGIPISKIYINETATNKVPNTSPTAGSTGSDLNGMAVLNACNKINKRLQPIKDMNPNGTWEEWITSAYQERISLSASGFYKTPDLGYDFETNSGNAFNYFTYGVAVTEVEIDCLTGDHQVLRTDIVMDVGQSLNPAIDVGQIEGAFMQGYGLFVLEEMMYSPTGTIHTKGAGSYKIPGFGNIPIEFNVSLLKGATNPRAVYSSKAIGEPPLFLASSVLFAIREAIKSARKDAGISAKFTLNAPTTVDKIRMLCQDNFTSMIKLNTPGTFVPWNVTA